MGSTNLLKEPLNHYLRSKLLPYTLYALFPIALFHLYFYPIPLSLFPLNQLPPNKPIIIKPSISNSPPIKEASCDYTNGKWVPDKEGPLYNGTNCGTIKDGQNCMSHGRPDFGYLHWKWSPNQCKLNRFEPRTFLKILENKHLAFVGDSMARNQLESLLCMLSSFSVPNLVYTNGQDNKFRRWHFSSHNFTASIYWSPFLVKGFEKSNEVNHNRLFLDSIDEKWAADLNQFDAIVLSIGHWFLHPAVYYDGDSVLGCHFCPDQNYTEIGYFDVYGKAVKTTLEKIMERRVNLGNDVKIVVTTFSPAHFEGEWDKLGACSKIKPYNEDEKKLEGFDADMRKAEIDHIENARLNARKDFKNVRIEALDITKIALLRPDGHPGPYMYPYPFANGVTERVQNDCVHWCLPGPIDTWNEILLDLMKRWKNESRRGKRISRNFKN